MREHPPALKVHVVTVVELMTLPPRDQHPHGPSDCNFDTLLTTDRSIVFACHGYPWLIHRLSYRRRNHGNLHVRGCLGEGTTTTPIDRAVLNQLDQFHLVADVIDRVPTLGSRAAHPRQARRDRLIEPSQYIRRQGQDLPEILGWRWRGDARDAPRRAPAPSSTTRLPGSAA